jgi:hypothetical protein
VVGVRTVTVLVLLCECRVGGGTEILRMAQSRPGGQVVSVLTLDLAESSFAKLNKKELSYEVLCTAVK